MLDGKASPPPRPAMPRVGLGQPPAPTGEAYDGDTFRLDNGPNARLYGVDAFELRQQGMLPNGQTVPLGERARSALLPYLTPETSVDLTGKATWGRPVASLNAGGVDPAQALARNGWALAAPEYLRDDPERRTSYLEAERLARQNRLGAHGTTYATPQSYRKGNATPWADAEWTNEPGEGRVAVFADEPTPFQGLRPEIEQGYLSIWQDPRSKADDLLAFASQNGFSIDPDNTRKLYAQRDAGGEASGAVTYETPPRLLTNPGDGRFGAALRGFADPVNLLDEMGAVVDTLGGTGGRENLFNSDRRFGDVLANNLQQNRAILGYDDATYPYTRFGGQLAGGVLLPGGAMRGVGMSAARQSLRNGASRLAAMKAATQAVRNRLATVGAVEGAVAGAGAGETTTERLTGAAVGLPAGAFLGAATGELLPAAIGALRGARGGRAALREAGDDIPPPPDGFEVDVPGAGIMEEGVDALPMNRAEPATPAEIAPPPPEGFTLDYAPARADTASEFDNPALLGPRMVDRIDVNQLRPLLGDVTEAQRAAQASRIDPRDVLPMPASTVGLFDLDAAQAGRVQLERAPNEADALESRYISPTVRKRGPLDLVAFLRTRGGVRPQGGELDSYGITNAERRGIDFAGGESRLGRLVNPDGGMSYAEAAELAWEAGYFPDSAERPTVSEFLDALNETHSGRNRAFMPDDYAEIDAFETARTQRQAVEAGQEAGSPIATDRGQPIGPDDLENLVPPVQAYEEWGEAAPNFAGNLRLDKLDSPQQIKRALVASEQRVGGFDPATRGRITQAETERLASELGMTADKLLSRRKGQAFNAEEALASRQILARSGNELVNLARRVQSIDDPGDELLAEFRQAWVRHVAIQEQIAGMSAEAGRALSQFRMVADSREARGPVLASIVGGGGGPERLKQAADILLDSAADPSLLNRVSAKAIKPKFRDKIVELWYNMLLSGPQTHVVNIVSNTLTSLAQLPEHAAASAIGSARRMIPSQRDTDQVFASELGARAIGLMQGTREGMRLAGRAFITGDPADAVTKIESQTQRAIGGPVGSIIRTPSRALTAEDELFKAIARRMELGGLAVRKASMEGLRGGGLKTRVAELLADPTDEMMEQAFDYGRYLTFQRQLGPFASKVSGAVNFAWPLKAVIPFIRTPTNLLKFTLERSPAAPLLKEWRNDYAAGGAKRDLAAAKAMVGTGMMALVAQLASQGFITGGGPKDESAKQLLRADGWQPYSLRVGDRYYSYQRLDPFASTIGIAADLVDLQDYLGEEEQDEIATMLGIATVKNLSSKTWLSGLTDMIEAIEDPDRNWETFTARLAGSAAVPAIVAQAARTTDPVLREARSPLDRIRSRVPGMSQGLEPRRDVWGQPIVGQGGLGPDIISPMWQSDRQNDPLNNALLDMGASISRPSKTVAGRALSPAEYGRYQEAIGNAARPFLRDLVGVNNPVGATAFNSLPVEDRREMVSRTMSNVRRDVRRGLFGARLRSDAPPPPPPGFQIDPPPAGFVLDR